MKNEPAKEPVRMLQQGLWSPGTEKKGDLLCKNDKRQGNNN